MDLSNCRKVSLYNLEKEFICDALISIIEEPVIHLRFIEPCAQTLDPKVLVLFYDNRRGLVTCHCRLFEYRELLGPTGNIEGAAKCQVIEELDVVQRRKDLKVTVDLALPMYLSATCDPATSFETEVVNLSAGGLFFRSTQLLRTGQSIHTRLTPGKRELTLCLEILRTEPADETGRNGYGCKFIHLSAVDENDLRQYVFQLDMKRNAARRR
jgi:hypothetical protein